MPMPPRLFRALLDLRSLREEVVASRVPEGVDPSEMLDSAAQLRHWEERSLPEFVQRRNEIPAILFPLAFVRRVSAADSQELDDQTVEAIERLGLSPSLARFWGLILATRTTRAGQIKSALEDLAELGNRSGDDPTLDQYVDAWIWQRRARLHRMAGNFQAATDALRWCEQTLPDQLGGSHHARRLNHDRGTLAWASGQLRRALELHVDPLYRSAAALETDQRFLLESHLSAAKCAIDLEFQSKASCELGSAKDIVDAHPGRFPIGEAFLVLYSAELDTLYGNDDEGIHLFEYAIELFEQLSPPFYPGVLDAKIGLIQFALKAGHVRSALNRVSELISEAERKGCLDARTRLLAYQATLLLHPSEDLRALREAYEDLVTRAHLMNNPQLTLRAYADLYCFARDHLSSQEQKFWLDRLRGLSPLLEQSCFQDLYREHILERYRQEIEGPLDELDLRLPEDLDDPSD